MRCAKDEISDFQKPYHELKVFLLHAVQKRRNMIETLQRS